MDNHNDRRTRQWLQLLLRYRQALDVGDLGTIAAVLRLAEDDPVLEAMLQEVDSISQVEEGITVPADRLLQAHDFVSTLRAETQQMLLDGRSNHQRYLPKDLNSTQKRQVQPMQQEPYQLPPTTREIGVNRSRRTRFVWATGFMRSAAAVLIVGVIITGFLVVLSQHAGMPRQTTSSVPTGSPHGIYFARSDGIYRLDIQTRKVIWHTQVPGLSSGLGAAPVVIGDTVYINTNAVAALEAQTGKLLWTHAFSTHGVLVGPYEEDGVLYFGTFGSSGGLPPSQQSAAIYAVNPTNGKITATYTPIQGQRSWIAPTVAGGYLYFISSSFRLTAVQLPGEKIVWQQQIATGWSINGAPWSLIVKNGVIYLPIGPIATEHDAGLFEAFDAHTGSKLWQSPPIPSDLRGLTVTNDTIYAGTYGNDLLAFDVHTHALVWRAPFDTYDVVSDSGRLYIECCSASPQIAVLDAATGHLLWRPQSTSLGLVLDSIYNGVVYVVGFDNNGLSGTIIALNAATGKQLWTMPTEVTADQWGGLVVV